MPEIILAAKVGETVFTNQHFKTLWDDFFFSKYLIACCC